MPVEETAPTVRIGHSVHIGLAGSTRVTAVGFRPARAYHKCGSRTETDWVRDARLLALHRGEWVIAWELRDIPRGGDDSTRWFDVDVGEASGLLVEVRRSWIDDWWPGWNLAEGAVLFRTEEVGQPSDPGDLGFHALPLDLAGFDVSGLPSWLRAARRGGSVWYETDRFTVAFRLGHPALSWLSIRSPQRPRHVNLLALPGLFDQPGPVPVSNIHHPLRGHLTQGTRLTESDGYESIGFLSDSFRGEVNVRGAEVRYVVVVPRSGQTYELAWQIERSGLTLAAVRSSDIAVSGVESSAWQLGFDSRMSPMASMAKPRREGETGMADGQVLAHLPGYGTLSATVEGDGMLRADVVRPFTVNTLEVKVGERIRQESDYLLPAGRHEAEFRLTLATPVRVRRRSSMPSVVAKVIERTGLSGLPYRLDTATISNNGSSQHVPFCLDMHALLALAVRPFCRNVDPLTLVRDSIDRYLAGGPGYGAGATSHGSFKVEDEFVMTRPAVLVGIAVLLAAERDHDWLERQRSAIMSLIDQTRKLDVDDDGLIECSVRQGVSGRREPSTNWWDEISFGWKDAFSNAILYDALMRLTSVLRELDEDLTAVQLERWAGSLRASYGRTFFNPATGWFAGWRSHDDALHDYAFLFVNGAAVTAGLLEPAEALEVMRRLWQELEASGHAEPGLGLPGNLRPIPDSDTPGAYPDLPFGFYQNGGISLSMARHFVAALYRVGMTAEGDELLLPMLGALADGSAFGGVGSGIDWRFWDGGPCGYEGLLSDQLGVLIPAIDRFGQLDRPVAVRRAGTS